MTAHTSTLFSFAGIMATLNFFDFDRCIGHVEATGFDRDGDYRSANVMYFAESFRTPAERDMAIANAMNFVATEMIKQSAFRAAWQPV